MALPVREVFVSIVICLMATSAMAVTAQRAVLVGIDDYSASRLPRPQNSSAEFDRLWPRLNGSVNDIHAMSEILVHLYGFKPQDIVFLEDQAATRSAIFHAIEANLIQPAAPGDVALFYFAGHGSQVPNRLSDEPDKLDESIVPADSRLGALDIRDKELKRLFNRALDKGARLTVVVDSCHSGSITRFPSGATFRQLKADVRDAADGRPTGPPLEQRGAVVISAAQDFELALETKDDRNRPMGSFSWAWIRALRDAVPGEPVLDTFLRTRARMRLECAAQDPVLSASPEAERHPFLDTRREGLPGRPVVAIAGLGAANTLTLEGGWANGLSVGTVLRPTAGGTGRVTIIQIDGLTRSVARITTVPEPEEKPFRSGAILEVVSWGTPPGATLRVWIPHENIPGPSPAQLAQAAAKRALRWIDDPIGEPPAYVIRELEGQWVLLGGRGVIGSFPATDTARMLDRVPAGASIFLHISAPKTLSDGIRIGPGTKWSGVQPVERPEDADYLLTGRFVRGHVEYSWLRPDVTSSDEQRSPLPVRTTWRDVSRLPEAISGLTEDIVRLQKIYAWHQLSSPAPNASPYRLIVTRAGDGRAVTDGILNDKEAYGLALQSKGEGRPKPARSRYFYVFVIDSFGTANLLFGHGSIDNHFPLPGSEPPSTISLGPRTSFVSSPPFGIDTFFLLTTEVPLADPSVLEWDGVRKRRLPEEPLDQLFVLLQTGRREGPNIPTPAVWSIEHVTFQSKPAGSR